MKNFLLTVLLLLLPMSNALSRTVSVCFYHGFPPFVLEKKELTPTKGLSADFVSYLNKKQSKYEFVGEMHPRKRMDNLIIKGKECVVPWVITNWFPPKIRDNVTWSEVYFPDSLEVLSLKRDPITYDSPESVAGKKIGWVLGWKWKGIDPLRESGKVHASDAKGPLQNFQKLLKKRIDVTLVHGASYKYFMKTIPGSESVFKSPKAHSTFSRKAFVNTNDTELSTEVLQIIKEMSSDPEWTAVLENY